MVVGEASIHNIMGGMESTGGVRLHNHKRKLKQRFDIIKKLGQGTYGKVQLGINKETGQEVAIKTIKKCKIETEADLIRIRREIQIMSSVQHPNIIHIYEVFENREKMVLVMEYAAGGELYDYLSERKVLSEQEARRIFRQISTAVFYCHKHKICHRDLKLENILLDQIGNAKIADFGLSNVFDEQRLLSTFCGSPLYASPEIVKGTPYHGPEVDCWSLGVLLYTLVYGAMPFDGSNFKRLVKQISQSDYFEPKKPSPASPLIKEMLTVCPTRRADIEKICTHWWVNEDYEENCLDIAEDLAAQTPVRLDLLLSLVPQSASAEKLVVGDQRADGDVANNMSTETLVPTRCHSVGSLMELDRNSSDRRIREMVEEEEEEGQQQQQQQQPRAATTTGDAKRKLETTPSMDETTAAGAKRKERSRRKERTDEREPRSYRSGSRHHSAPIPNSITEEAMEAEPVARVTIPTSKTVDLDQVEAAAACLELIEESREKLPGKKGAETPETISVERDSMKSGERNTDDARKRECVEATNEGKEKSAKVVSDRESSEGSQKSPERKKVPKKKVATREVGAREGESAVSKTDVPDKEGESAAAEAKGVAANRAPTKKVVPDEKNAAKKESAKVLKDKALSLDSELSNEPAEVPAKPVERRKSKIFETAEKFNQMAANAESEKPKKIFIPGVNVGGAKRAFERKASLSAIAVPQTVKHCASKVIIDVPTDKKDEEKVEEIPGDGTAGKDEKTKKREEEKKRAVDIITGAIGKPPVQKKSNGSPPTSPESYNAKKLGLKLQVGPNDVRTATVSVSTPVETRFPFETKPTLHAEALPVDSSPEPSTTLDFPEEPKKSSKMEITLKSATLPRPRKTSKAEITLAGVKSPENTAFKSEVEAKIDAFHPQKLRTQRSEVAFPVAAAVPQANRSSSLEPEGRPKMIPKERIIPIQVESKHRQTQHSTTPPPKPPIQPQRSMSQRSGSLSRQSTADSDTDSALGSTTGPEPIRKSPREYIIPIAVEGGGYVTPRSGSVEPESKTGTPTSTSAPRSRFGRPRRMSSLLSDASEDESPFSTLHRDSDDLLQRHMHRLRSSRPTRQPLEHADSLSSGEDDDDDGFELLTAENLFSTLLSRVRSLTQRLNVDDNRGTGFPSSRLLGRLGSNSPQGFWGIHEPLSRRLSESQFRRSLSRDTDRFGRKDSTGPTSPGAPSSPGPRNTPSRESIFEMGSNTLPRDKAQHEDVETEATQIARKQAQESLEQNFTPSLARRLSRQFIEQTRQSLPRSPSVPRENTYQSAGRQMLNLLENCEAENGRLAAADSTTSERSAKRSSNLLEPRESFERRSPRRSIGLFDDDDEDKSLPPLPRQVMTLGRKYRDAAKSNQSGGRRESFHGYRTTDKIQEEPGDDAWSLPRIKTELVDGGAAENGSMSECNSESACNSHTNIVDTASSLSAKSSETSPTESTSNVLDYSPSALYKPDISRDFENRLLAAENLIKESKLKNLRPAGFDVNLNSSYKDANKCDKETLGSISDISGVGRSRSYIPSLRLRSGSLTRDPITGGDRVRSFVGSRDTLSLAPVTSERSILSKFFKPGGGGGGGGGGGAGKEKSQKSSGQRRISRFLRPDFFDTPREESQYVKDKEARKAAENERRKSRFAKKKGDDVKGEATREGNAEESTSKGLKNEANSVTKEKSESTSKSEGDVGPVSGDPKPKFERQSSRNSFLHSLEKKLEKFRSNDDSSKLAAGNGALIERKIRSLRENSAPPTECLPTESDLIKRAVSVEDLSLRGTPAPASKSKVASVLGLFKSIDTRSGASCGSARPQSTLLSKLKKNPCKGPRSDSASDKDPSASKIPTKALKGEVKSPKVLVPEKGKSLERSNANLTKKPSPPKERSKGREKISPSARKTASPEKVAPNEARKMSTEKAAEAKIAGSEVKGNGLPEKIISVVENSSERSCDDEQTGAKNKDSAKKDVDEPKKNVPIKNGVTKAEKESDAGKRVKKVTKTKDSAAERETTDGTKKKKIVRVVRRVVKKSSDSSDSKSEGKDKTGKTLIKKITSPRKEKTQEAPAVTGDGGGGGGGGGGSDGSNRPADKEKSPETRVSKEPDPKTSAGKSGSFTGDAPDGKIANATESKAEKENVENNSQGNGGSDCGVAQPKLLDCRANRNSLKLDLSKIPQHAFRNAQPSKKPETWKAGSSGDAECNEPTRKADTAEEATKLTDNLSKMTHHANIMGNKIIIDKPLCAKDVADLKRRISDPREAAMPEITVSVEVAPNATTRTEPISNEVANSCPEESPNPANDGDKIVYEKAPCVISALAPPPSEINDDPFSPIEDAESFDSWSVCSADTNHPRSELHSPTSPTYSPSIRGVEHSDSVIDRIRRKSFYSRFNDRRRKTSLTAPPPGVTLHSSATLPRKFNSNRQSERDRDDSSGYVSPGRRYPERSYSLYNEDVARRKSPMDGYSDFGGSTVAYSNDFKSPVTEHYAGTLASSYVPSRGYVRSPTFDAIAPLRKYRGTDFGIDKDLGVHGPSDFHSGRSSSLLPKRYGSTVSNLEPKTAEYYEELLAPSHSEYLTARKSPISGEYSSRYENGYHNGSSEMSRLKSGEDVDDNKSRAYLDGRAAGADFAETSDKRLGD